MHEGVWMSILGLFGLLTLAVLILPFVMIRTLWMRSPHHQNSMHINNYNIKITIICMTMSSNGVSAKHKA